MSLCVWLGIFQRCLCGSVCTEWLDNRLWFSASNGSTRGVSQSWGLCEALWAAVWFQVACSQLAAFVWLKHSETLGFLKMQCHSQGSVQEIISFMRMTSYSIDEALVYWWDHFILMGSFFVISIWMASDDCVILSSWALGLHSSVNRGWWSLFSVSLCRLRKETSPSTQNKTSGNKVKPGGYFLVIKLLIAASRSYLYDILVYQF